MGIPPPRRKNARHASKERLQSRLPEMSDVLASAPIASILKYWAQPNSPPPVLLLDMLTLYTHTHTHTYIYIYLHILDLVGFLDMKPQFWFLDIRPYILALAFLLDMKLSGHPESLTLE